MPSISTVLGLREEVHLFSQQSYTVGNALHWRPMMAHSPGMALPPYKKGTGYKKLFLGLLLLAAGF